jgi:hypothetical protein
MNSGKTTGLGTADRPNRVRVERSMNPSSQVPGSKAGNPAKRKETM